MAEQIERVVEYNFGKAGVLRFGALDLEELEKYKVLVFETMPNFEKCDPWDAMWKMIPAITDSLRAYHPDITDQEVKKLLTVHNVFHVFNRVMQASFLKVDAVAAGEPQPVAQ